MQFPESAVLSMPAHLSRPASAGSAGSAGSKVPESEIHSLMLLTETKMDRNRELERVVENPVMQVEDTFEDDRVPICKAVGPFSALGEGQDVVAQLASLDLSVVLQAIDKTTSESDYRLLIPPADSLEDAFRRHRELKSNNIESYVITQGPRKRGISLGLFSTRIAADQARENLPNTGYKTEIIETPRIAREYWVVPSDGPEIEMTEATWRSLKDEEPELRRQMIVCVN